MLGLFMIPSKELYLSETYYHDRKEIYKFVFVSKTPLSFVIKVYNDLVLREPDFVFNH
jgi:hypothetical protein